MGLLKNMTMALLVLFTASCAAPEEPLPKKTARTAAEGSAAASVIRERRR